MNNRLNVENFKKLIAIESKKEYLTNNKSL